IPTSESDHWDFISRQEAEARTTNKVAILQAERPIDIRVLEIARIGVNKENKEWSAAGPECYRFRISARSSSADPDTPLVLRITSGGPQAELLASATGAVQTGTSARSPES